MKFEGGKSPNPGVPAGYFRLRKHSNTPPPCNFSRLELLSSTSDKKTPRNRHQSEECQISNFQMHFDGRHSSLIFGVASREVTPLSATVYQFTADSIPFWKTASISFVILTGDNEIISHLLVPTPGWHISRPIRSG